ncbi:MAG: nucleoside triphosphate pyrophosphohydrolase [Thermodesulfobacteriota bacterium]
MSRNTALDRVSQVLDRLLDPSHGCPWDLKQTPETLRLYLLEETHELLAALEQGDRSAIKEEMGDCLFLIFFLAKVFQKKGLFDLAEVLDLAADKMIARHPHIFGSGRNLNSAEEVKAQWHELKQKEKEGSLLAGVPEALPALLKAHRLSERAGRVGFDWPDPEAVISTLDLELTELRQALARKDLARTADELGDVLFTLANLARHLKINSEDALRRTNNRFTRRFKYIEAKLAAEGRRPAEAGLEEMDRLWAEAKSEGL